MQVPTPHSWTPLALIPFSASLFWLLASSGLWGVPVGALLMTGAMMMWMAPGTPRATALAALGGLLALPAGLIWMITGSFFEGLIAATAGVASALAAARFGVLLQPRPAEVPPPRADLRLDLKAALDEALLGYFVLGARIPSGADAVDVCDQAQRLEQSLRERGLLDDPRGLYPPVPAPESVQRTIGRTFGFEYESLRFPTAFVADEQLPGGAVWNRLEANREVTLRVMRQSQPGAPWLVCIHGYRMGVPWMDLPLFSPRWLHEGLGLNLALPVLPLHGPRKIGLRSGDFYLDGDPLDLFHAQVQAISDLRQTVAWIRTQEPGARIGVFGVSLGGYNAALLSCVEPDLDFALAAIPVSDFSSALWRILPPAHQAFFTSRGLDAACYQRILKPVSPLGMATRLAVDRRFVLGAVADRVVPADQPLALAQHWGVEPIWYQGSHLSVRRERATRDTLERAIVTAGWPLPLPLR